MPAIPMRRSVANHMASDWLALRDVWSEVPAADRAAALDYFQLSESDLMSFTRDQLVYAYTYNPLKTTSGNLVLTTSGNTVTVVVPF